MTDVYHHRGCMEFDLYVLQLDHCAEEEMWKDSETFRSMADKKPTDSLSEKVIVAFMKVSSKTTQKNHKKRRSMDQVCLSVFIVIILSHTNAHAMTGFGDLG